MATINSATFNAGSTGMAGVYVPGDAVTATLNYTPDAPGVVPTTFTTTQTITDSSGAVVAQSNSSFVVNEPQAAGDVASITDAGPSGATHQWVAGATTPNADGSLTVTFSTTA